MNSKNFSLTKQEQQALETLCAETFANRAPVNAVNFRADHEEFRAVIRRLCQLRYVDEDDSTQAYVPTVLGLREVGPEDCNGVLALGARLLGLFRQRYRNKETRKQNFLLGNIAAQLGVDRVELNFSIRSGLDLPTHFSQAAPLKVLPMSHSSQRHQTRKPVYRYL